MNDSCAAGDTTLLYPHCPRTGAVGFSMIPKAMLGRRAAKRATLDGLPWIDAMPGAEGAPASAIDSLVQFKTIGSEYPGAFAQGMTLRNAPELRGLAFASQLEREAPGGRRVETVLRHERGWEALHAVRILDEAPAFVVHTEFRNRSAQPVALEMLASFCLGGITPFHASDAPGRLRAHRFRSGWSAEGRLCTQSIEELHLERSWSGAAAFSERFGQAGTMPVRRWFPFAAVEDIEAGVCWGAMLCWAGSWQMEIHRQHDNLSLSGGLADREMGHWTKALAPGASIASPPAILACVRGGIDELCDRLVAAQEAMATGIPEREHDLPVVFNEWCTTWGDPRQEKLEALAQRLEGSGVRYFVIDAGWYKPQAGNWGNGHGDWVPNAEMLPMGLKGAADAIRARGMEPGLWFEMETAGEASELFRRTDLLLARDGAPITTRERRFLDLANPAAIDYLRDRVIRQLREGGFGYIKVDYNESAGIGCDDPDSLGEGLRKRIDAMHAFFDELRGSIPGLVVENCASGGHRLEPSMVARTAMSSFSDAHETPEIPIIAAALQRLVPPRQLQVWAVLHETDTRERMAHSLAATFLGRMALSGAIDKLSAAQWALVREAIAFQKQAAPIIREGTSRRFGELGASWRHPSGWQAVRRVAADGASILVVAHAYDGAPESLEVPLPEGGWRIAASFAAEGAEAGAGALRLRAPSPSGQAALLRREDSNPGEAP